MQKADSKRFTTLSYNKNRKENTSYNKTKQLNNRKENSIIRTLSFGLYVK